MMARLPRHLKFVRRESPPKGETGTVRMVVRFRWWHPRVWCIFVRTFVRIYREKRSS